LTIDVDVGGTGVVAGGADECHVVVNHVEDAGDNLELIVAVAPNALTALSLSSATSMAITWEAPKARAICTMFEPTPPTATTATVSPYLMSAPRRTAP